MRAFRFRNAKKNNYQVSYLKILILFAKILLNEKKYASTAA
jgi:hypothetical protein